MQKRLNTEPISVKYSYGPYNKIIGDRQRVRITEGCPNNCPYCYEPQEIKIFEIPKIERNSVEISDMNLLCKEQALNIIKTLGQQKVNGKNVHYELLCGIDYRFLTSDIAITLFKNRFGGFIRNNWYPRIRLAWDWYYKDQRKIKSAIDKLVRAGYRPRNIMIFMICNWKVSYEECCKKLDLCKVWGVQAADCYFDNQVFPNVIPIHWTNQENKSFRKKVRKHNQLVTRKIDPEI